MSGTREVRMGRPLYGGTVASEDESLALPFVLRKELVEVSSEGKLLRILERAPERVEPRCPHFGSCGGCQYQMIEGREQLDVKRGILEGELQAAGVRAPVAITGHSGEGYEYRNRIRLRVQRVAGEWRAGYNVRGTTEFLPVVTCPISAPVLFATAEAVLAAAASDRDAEYWLDAASELELFGNDDMSKVQVTLWCGPRTKAPQGSFERFLKAVSRLAPQVVGGEAAALDPRTGPTGRTLAQAGSAGLAYRVGDETYWITRGGFFQVNRFLVGELVRLVTEGRSGAVAWDLFAGVGLFSRVLARSYTSVTAVEANAVAATDLRAALAKLSAAHTAVQASTLEFLRAAVVQRERPDVVVLDPPRAGAGMEACALLVRLAAPCVVYVSCDPTTLARDLAVLQGGGYDVAEVHAVDLFPQTFHLESVVVLRR